MFLSCFGGFKCAERFSLRQVFCWSVSGTGIMVMLRRVLIRRLWNSSASDGNVSLTGVSRYVVMALVMSMSLVLFFRICSTVATALYARPLLWW